MSPPAGVELQTVSQPTAVVDPPILREPADDDAGRVDVARERVIGSRAQSTQGSRRHLETSGLVIPVSDLTGRRDLRVALVPDAWRESIKRSRSRVDSLPTNLTQANRSAGRDHLRHRPRTVRGRYGGVERSLCRGCGVEIKAGQAWCAGCRPGVKLQAGLDGLAAGRALRAEMRLRGQDPAASDAARRSSATVCGRGERKSRPGTAATHRSSMPRRFGGTSCR